MFRQRARRVVLVVGLLGGCTSPVVYGRTGRVAPAGTGKVTGGTNVAVAFNEVEVRYPADGTTADTATPEGKYTDKVAGFRVHTATTEAHLWFGWAVSGQWNLALSFFDPCEVGFLIGLPRGGMEFRCGLVGAHRGRFALAVSGGVAHQLLLPPHAAEARAGVDMSLHYEAVEPFINLYLGRGAAERGVRVPKAPGADPDANSPVLEVVRDEWRLAVPVGLAFPLDDDPAPARILLAVQPELTIQSEDRNALATNVVAQSQVWALYFTIRAENTFGD